MASKTASRRRHSPERVRTTRQRHVLLLTLLVVIVYASALGGDFVWTDREDLLQGHHRLTGLHDVPAMLTLPRDAYRARLSGAPADPATGTWQPVTLLSNSLDWLLWRDCAFCFHLVNLLLHLATVIGLYALGRHLLAQRRRGARTAAWSAALFAVHPATVASVAWIGGRAHLLAALLAVWSLFLFTRLQATTKSHRHHVRRWLVLGFGSALAAMLAHELAFVLPFAALLIAAFESRERGRHPLAGIAAQRWAALGLLALAPLLIIAYRMIVMGGVAPAGAYPADAALDNIGTALRHFWFLVQEALIPGEPVISDAWRITRGWGAAETTALLGTLLLLAAVGLGLAVGEAAALGAAWFLLWILPGVGMIPAERYHDAGMLYVATWGVALAVASGLMRLWRPLGRQLMPGSEALMFGPLILVLGVITAFSSARWWDHAGLFESEVAHDPHYIEGRLQSARVALERGRAEVALNHVEVAGESAADRRYTGDRSPYELQMLLGRARLALAEPEAALEAFTAALEARPGDPAAMIGVARTHLQRGEFADAERVLAEARAAGADADTIDADIGVVRAGQQRFVEAYPLLQRAVQQGRGNALHRRALAQTFIDAGELDAAVGELEVLLDRRETAADRARLAWVLWRLGRETEARQQLNRALQLDDGSDPYVDRVLHEMGSAAAGIAEE